jgi:alkylation response protein AidB-like acyl-CoA dehydrogenase
MNDGSGILLDEAELAALRESIVDVLNTECDSRTVHAWLDRDNDLGPAIWRQAAELGWLGLALPEADGGLGLGVRGLQILIGELGARVTPGGFIPTICVAQWLATVADADLRATLLGPVVAGQAGFALPTVIEGASVVPLSSDGKAVTGKIDIAGCAPGSVESEFAVVPLDAAWAIVRIDGATATAEPIEIWDLTRDLFVLNCANAPIVAKFDDPSGALGTLLGSYLAVALAADSLGGANAIMHKTIDYMKERVQFDRTIATFQALRHRIADMAIAIATQNSLLEQAVQCLDNGSPDAAMWARISKARATETFASTADDCIKLHGGVGHTWEFDPHIYIKRAFLNEALLGNNRAMRDTAIGLLDRAMDEGRTTTELDT